jgi:CBS domain-containing protein
MTTSMVFPPSQLIMSKHSIDRKHVRDVMSKHIVAVNPGDSVSDALRLMVQNRVSALPVVDGSERCVGVISSTDVLQLALQFSGELDALNTTEGLAHELLIEKLEQTGFSNQVVNEVMTHVAVTVEPDAKVVTAAAAMLRHRVHRLPVADPTGKLVGLVSSMDIVRAVAESGE